MHQAAHASAGAGRSYFLRQLHMHPVKGRLRAMQNRNQIDHGIVPCCGAGQGCGVMDIQLLHRQTRQVLHLASVAAPAGRHRHAPTGTHQLFTNMAANKTGAAQNQNVFHGDTVVFCMSPMRRRGFF